MDPIYHIRDVDMLSPAVMDCHPLVSAKRIKHLGNPQHHGNEINHCIDHTNTIINKIKHYICTPYHASVRFDINSNSACHSSKHYPCTNIFSPSMDSSLPISVSYTITTPQNILSSNSKIICNTPNTINNILSKTPGRNMNRVDDSGANSSNNSLQWAETPQTHTSKPDITFNFSSVDNPITNKTLQLHILSESESKDNQSSKEYDIVMSEDEICEVMLLQAKGYNKLKK